MNFKLIFTFFIMANSLWICPSIAVNNTNNETKKTMFNSNSITPKANKIPKTLSKHGKDRLDNYYWMNERETAPVLDYLNAENKYFDEVTAPQNDLREQLYNELKGRIKQTDMSVPYQDNGYFYYSKVEEGKEYTINCRKKGSLDASEEVLFDQNKMAEGSKYFALGYFKVAPNNSLIGYSIDLVSRRQYTIHFKDIKTGKELTDKIENTSGGFVWANDNKTLFYTLKDEALREYRVMKHTLGTEQKDDQIIFEEKDQMFDVSVGISKSKKYIFVSSHSTMADEYQFISANEPNSKFKMFHARERGLEYNIDHAGDKFYIKTNKDAFNFKLMSCDESSTEKNNWTDIIAHRADVLLEDFDVFKDYIVLTERINGQTEVRVKSWSGDLDEYIKFPEQVYSSGTGTNIDYETKNLRLSYTSLTTPSSVIDYNMQTKERKLLKEQEILGGFDKNNYVAEKLYAKAIDGTLIPISLVRRKDTKIDGSAPLLQYAYGSYGISTDVYFSADRLSLLDRGFIFALAHIRGGEDMGRPWYENGKLLKKKNTFTDFIDCAHHLVDNKYTSNEKLFAMGGSAGGLLMGAVANMDGNYFKGMVALVPFVDVVTTMLDETIPLTTGEYDEWGNPNVEEYFKYMLSYSPVDNVETKPYPNMLVMTGYHDSQVQYFEPAKWVAKLREMKTNNNLILFRCNMDAGHGGSSGRFKRLRETAIQYSFMLGLLGIGK